MFLWLLLFASLNSTLELRFWDQFSSLTMEPYSYSDQNSTADPQYSTNLKDEESKSIIENTVPYFVLCVDIYCINQAG